MRRTYCGLWGRRCYFSLRSPEQIYQIAKEVHAGSGVLFLYGNYTGDIMTFDMASDLCDMDDIECKSIVGADDVNSHADPDTRRGVAGIYFMFKAAGARADEGGTLEEVVAAAAIGKRQYTYSWICPYSVHYSGSRSCEF